MNIAPTLPRALLAILLVALLVVAPRPSGAEGDAPNPEDAKRKAMESKRKDVSKKSASAHATLGDWCHGKKLFEAALAEFKRSLEFDPDQSKARERLGFVKKDGQWSEDPKKAPKKKDEAPESTKYALLDEYKLKAKKEADTLANSWCDFGDYCKKAGFETEAKDAWRVAIDYARDHAKAREALGFKKEASGAWVDAGDRAEKDAMQKKAAEVAGGEVIQKETADDKVLGKKTTKRQSTHFFFQTTLPEALLPELIKLAELTRDQFYAEFEVPTDRNLVEKIVWGVLLNTKEEHDKWIDGMMDGSDGNRDWYKRGGGFWKPEPPQYEGYKGQESDEGVKDFVVHYTAHVFFHYYMIPKSDNVKPWLYEGMGHYFTHKIMRTGLTNCIVQSTGGGGKKGVPRDSDYWKQFIREAVTTGADPEMNRVMIVGVNELDGETLVKAWSVLDFLMTTRKKDFFTFLERLKEADGTDKGQEEALKSALGWGYAELDHEWELYVKKNY